MIQKNIIRSLWTNHRCLQIKNVGRARKFRRFWFENEHHFTIWFPFKDLAFSTYLIKSVHLLNLNTFLESIQPLSAWIISLKLGNTCFVLLCVINKLLVIFRQRQINWIVQELFPKWKFWDKILKNMKGETVWYFQSGGLSLFSSVRIGERRSRAPNCDLQYRCII